jgi:hypothetical protein
MGQVPRHPLMVWASLPRLGFGIVNLSFAKVVYEKTAALSSPAQGNQQNLQVCGGNARNAPCLAQRAGLYGRQLLPRLQPQAAYCRIVRAGGQQHVLHFAEAFGLLALHFNVSGVFYLDIYLLAYGGGHETGQGP